MSTASSRCWWACAAALLVGGCSSDPPDLVRKTIGPAGGLVSSHDGVLSLAFLPGALEREHEIVIFPSDEPPPIFGPAYRVQPDIELLVDVEVSYSRSLPNDSSGVAVAAIHLDDYSDEMGHWVPLPRLSIHEESSTVIAIDSELSLYYGMLEAGGSGSTTNVDTTDPVETDGEATGTSGNDSGTTADPTDPSDTDPSDTDPSDTDSETTAPGCGNGTPEPGELCFVEATFAMSGGPVDVTLGDFDQDGRLDVATANADGSYSTRLGDGSGGFGNEANVAAGNAPAAIASDDLDQAMGDDLVIALAGTNQMLLLQSQGNGSFGPNLVGLAATAPSEVLLVDVDHNGGSDILVLGSTSATASFFPFNMGGLGPQTPYNTNPVANPVGAAWGHYNFNDDMINEDVIVFGGGDYAVLAGNGTTLGNAVLPAMLGTDLRRAVGGEFGGSGAGDAAVADFAEGGVYVMIGDGTPLGFSSIEFYPTGAGAIDVALGDATGDGDPDLVVANNGADTLTLLTKTGGSAWDQADDFPAGTAPTGVVMADLNGDGLADIVVCSEMSNDITVLVSDP